MDWFKKYKVLLKEHTGMSLDEALEILVHYIRDNNYEGDMNDVARVIRDHGYEETKGHSIYYRGIFHEITDEDKNNYQTVSELYKHLKEHSRFDMTGLQGFTTDIDNVHNFIRGQLHYMVHDVNDFIHDGSTLLEDLKSIIIVYAVEIPERNILWSMNGLKYFLQRSPKSPIARELYSLLTDIWDGYGSDDEVFADMKNTILKDIILYEHDNDE
jgi:hypothetical protein